MEEVEMLFILLFEINESLSMSEFDKTRYSEMFLEDDKDRRKIDLLLAGHIHAYAENDGTLVADKMLYEGKTNINGYVIHDMRSFFDPDKKERRSQYKRERL